MTRLKKEHILIAGAELEKSQDVREERESSLQLLNVFGIVCILWWMWPSCEGFCATIRNSSLSSQKKSTSAHQEKVNLESNLEHGGFKSGSQMRKKMRMHFRILLHWAPRSVTKPRNVSCTLLRVSWTMHVFNDLILVFSVSCFWLPHLSQLGD